MLLLFNGPPGSGKDEACSFLRKHGFEHKLFKEQLFVDVLEHYKLDAAETVDFFLGYFDRARKEEYVDYLGCSRRQAMIHVSENVMKKIHGKTRYGDFVASTLVYGNDYSMSDSGFMEELNPVVDKIGEENVVIVQIFRDGCTFEGDSRNYIKGRLVDVFDDFREFFPNKDKIDKTAEYRDPHSKIKLVQLHNNGSLDQFRKNVLEIARTDYAVCDVHVS